MKRFVLFLLFVILASACNPALVETNKVRIEQTRLAIANNLKTLTYPATETQSATATQQPIQTITSSATPTTLHGECVRRREGVSLSALGYADFPVSALQYLNEGGDPSQLENLLSSLGIANQPVSVGQADFNGDGSVDYVISIFDPDSIAHPPEGGLFIFLCQQVNSTYALARIDGFKSRWSAPGMDTIEDLNSDELDELVTSQAMCGAHSCIHDVKILTWEADQMRNVLEGDTEDLPNPVIKVTDDDGDGIFSMQMISGGFASVGAGPQRTLTRVWGFDHETRYWKIESNNLGPSDFRIHMLHDADDAFLKRDVKTALILYRRVVDDSTLTDWQDPGKEREVLSAYALYKTIVLYGVIGNMHAAEIIYEEISSSVPPTADSAAFVEIARLFLDGLKRDGFVSACGAARNFASSDLPNVLKQMGSQMFGYANKEFTTDDICRVEWKH